MAYRELVRRWHEGVLAADGGDWDAALDIFAGIPEPPSRICFNMGCVQLLAGRPEEALRVSGAGWGRGPVGPGAGSSGPGQPQGGTRRSGRPDCPLSIFEGTMLKLQRIRIQRFLSCTSS